MAVEHQYFNLTKEEQIRCVLRLLEPLKPENSSRKGGAAYETSGHLRPSKH